MKVNAHQKRWNEKYDLLVEYKQEHGHCNVPRNDITYGQKLGLWVKDQRASCNKGTLINYRLVRLNEIGFNWSASLAWRWRCRILFAKAVVAASSASIRLRIAMFVQPRELKWRS